MLRALKQEVDINTVGSRIRVDISEATVSVESESRVVYRPEIRTYPKHAGSKQEQISAATTIILPTTATIGSTMGQFTFNGRVDEVDEYK
ncbi:hypothetical protein CR513_33892, partial [Mucuna pruriens]